MLLVTPEAVPFAKTGGLADVCGALPRALARQGHDVTVVLPRYRGAEGHFRLLGERTLALGGRSYAVRFLEAPLGPEARAVLVDVPELYDRRGLYGIGSDDYPDNAVRFAFLARAALFYAGHLADRPPEIVHAHDWQGGLAPVYLKLRPEGDGTPKPAAIFTIHNLAFQGLFPPETLPAIDLGWDLFTPEHLEYWGSVSYLKAGINYADWITTVSPRYAKEILTPAYGFGFEGILAARREVLTGILNGADYERWDPRHDPYLPEPFGPDDLSGKLKAKAELLRALRLPAEGDALDRLTIGMVSRLTEQKGLDLIEQAAADLTAIDATYVLLGSGEERFERFWLDLAARHPARVAARIGFDDPLAHLIIGGSDALLMPSRFEPCGLNQMYALRYGTVPIVRATGGLDDTVVNYNERSGRGTGFKFIEYTPAALVRAVRRALRVFRRRAEWRELQLAGMREDFSWDVSAREYVKVYRKALASARGA
ncbi:MAG TPA: glycogen synthase GlgA [Vicinamibacterales bacterium]|nr:glycogen synthase GlgA [Vicinamibacterales bacterium]